MKRLTLATSVIAAISAVALAGTAVARMHGPEHMDANKDGQITKEEFAAGKADHFAKMDSNKDGFLDKSEIGDRKMKMGRGHHGGGHGPMMMMEADADKNGKISEDEFMAQAKTRFAEMDANGDRFLDEADRAEHERQCASPTKICGPMGRLDTDKDGKVSKAEFVSGPHPLFERLDSNNDGVVSKAEFEAKHKGGHKHGDKPGQ